VSQSHPGESDDHGALDPLLAFNAEFAAAESSPKPVVSTASVAAPQPEDVAPLRLRLDQAERSLDRARIEISALKSDLATLVTAVDDIKKRLSRRLEAVVVPQPVRPPPRRGLLKVVGIALLCLTIGAAAMWSLATADVIELPSPFDSARESASVAQDAPVEMESSVELQVPDAATVVATAAEQLQAVANAPPRQGPYVGTLSIDAAPAGEVFIDRRLAGRTPLRAENLRAGSHLIWIEREGYRRWTRVVAVAADRVSRVSARLDPLSR